MSNPNPVNLNNLDGRYSTPSSVDAKIAAQALTDAGQYAQQWKANTTYAVGQITIAPDGSTVQAISGFTSTSTYNPVNWTVLSPTASSIASQYVTSAQVSSQIAVPTRTAMLHIGGSGGQSAATSVGQLLCRVPLRLPQTTKRWRLRISGQSLLDNSIFTGAIPLDGVWFGEAAFGSDGTLTSGFTATPTQVLTSQSTPSDGSVLVGPWITDVSTQWVANRTYMISYSANYGSGNIVRGSGWTFYSTQNAAAAASSAAMSPANGLDATVMDVEIEYDTVTDRPMVMFIGDSLTDGWKSGYGVTTSYPTLYGQITGVIPIVNAYAGALTSQWTSANQMKYTRYSGLSIDAVHIGLGTNDLSQGVSVATVQANFATIVANIRTVWGRDVLIYANTIQPFNGSGTNETNRNTYNTWLRNLPYGLAGIIDFDRVVRNASNVATLDTDYSQGDGIHIKTAGHRAEALAMPSRIRRVTS